MSSLYPPSRDIRQTVREEIYSESMRAPGLRHPPSSDRLKWGTSKSRYLKIANVNYSHLPMNLEGPKVMWVELHTFPPGDLKVGTPVKFHLTPERGIRTSIEGSSSNLNSVFEVSDIIGKRVILQPYRSSVWMPTVHESCDNPFGWGYNLRVANVHPGMQNPLSYGYGISISYIEYLPEVYSEKSRRLLGRLITQGYYQQGRM